MGVRLCSDVRPVATRAATLHRTVGVLRCVLPEGIEVRGERATRTANEFWRLDLLEAIHLLQPAVEEAGMRTSLLHAVERLRSVVRAGDEAAFVALMQRGREYLGGLR